MKQFEKSMQEAVLRDQVAGDAFLETFHSKSYNLLKEWENDEEWDMTVLQKIKRSLLNLFKR